MRGLFAYLVLFYAFRWGKHVNYVFPQVVVRKGFVEVDLSISLDKISTAWRLQEANRQRCGGLCGMGGADARQPGGLDFGESPQL